MDLASRIGAANAQVIMVAKGGRGRRYDALMRGEETPREFFYGFLDLEKEGIPAAMMSSAAAMPGLLGNVADRVERAFASYAALGVRPFSTRRALPVLADADVVMSFTDGFSLSLGLGIGRLRRRPILLGGFHGLSDIEARPEVHAHPLVRSLIRRALAGLDHAFFFGETDRKAAIAAYAIAEERTSVIPFGVDTEFWRPLPGVEQRDVAVAVGQDLNRDFELLARAPGRNPTRIVTRRKVAVPADASHVEISTGDFFGSDTMTDEELRTLYNMASAIVVPLRDVNQPTGYSVTLQAMSCGRPVILSRIRGLWTPELLVDGENCLLVPPGDAEALGRAVTLVRTDRALAGRLSQAARLTAERHFNLDAIGRGTIDLARRGLAEAKTRAL
jgi:glycosyltransferase involved in cell wall biosynthesis